MRLEFVTIRLKFGCKSAVPRTLITLLIILYVYSAFYYQLCTYVVCFSITMISYTAYHHHPVYKNVMKYFKIGSVKRTKCPFYLLFDLTVGWYKLSAIAAGYNLK